MDTVNEQNSGPAEPVPVDLSDDGYATRVAIWRMALGMQELADAEARSARELPSRGTSSWLGELAAQHAHGEVGSGDLLDAIELHYLDETDAAHLVERRADLLVARIVMLLLEEPGKPSFEELARIHATLSGAQWATVRTVDLDEPESILGGRSVQYIPHTIITDVATHELSSFLQVTALPGLQGQRNLGMALVKLLAGLWRTRPFGFNDALVLGVFLLRVLRRFGVLVSPEPFAHSAGYFRNALVRSCFSCMEPRVGETLRFLELFCSNLFAGGNHVLLASDTECLELQEKTFELQRVVRRRDRGFYVLKLHDEPLALLRFEPHWAGDITIEGVGVEERLVRLMPPNLVARCDQMELERFVKSRLISRRRTYRGELLAAYGISGARTWAISHFSRGVCATDGYSIVPEGEETPYKERSVFGNLLDPTLQRVGLRGELVRETVRRVGVPAELTSGGTAPKAWRAEPDGGLALYKTTRSPRDLAPGTEHLASLIARAIGAGGVAYGLGEWHGKTCSVCTAFTSPDVSFMPYELCMERDALRATTLSSALAWYDGLGAQSGEAFRTIAVLDYLLANPSRGVADHGVMRDAHTCELLGVAPAFDYDDALFAHEEELPDLPELLARAEELEGMFHEPLAAQARLAAGEGQQGMLERALDLDAGDLDLAQLEEFSPEMLGRIETLVAFVRARAQQLLR